MQGGWVKKVIHLTHLTPTPCIYFSATRHNIPPQHKHYLPFLNGSIWGQSPPQKLYFYTKKVKSHPRKLNVCNRKGKIPPSKLYFYSRKVKIPP